MGEQFILFGKKKKEFYKPTVSEREAEAKAYLTRVKREDEQMKIIRQAKAERFKRSNVGRVVGFIDKAASGKAPVPMKKKKKGKGKGVRIHGGRDAFFGGDNIFRF